MPTNEERKHYGLYAVECFRSRASIPDTEPDSVILTDLLTNLRHAFPRKVFESAVAMSETHYESER